MDPQLLAQLAALRNTQFNMTPGILPSGGLDTGGLNLANTTNPTGGGMGGNWSWFGDNQQAGVIPAAITGANALAQGWLGFQQLGLAKDNLAFQKDAFNKNYGNQRQLTNQQLVERQQYKANVNPGQFAQPTDEWKGQNLLK